MLPMFGVSADRIDWYLSLHDHAKAKGWWDGNQAIPEWFATYIGLEWGATEIRSWDLGYVPGLLQTRAYAEAVLRCGNGTDDGDDTLPQRLELRTSRQQALHRADHPLALHAVIDESVLHRTIGGPDVMREQLLQLTKMARQPQITIQVLPFTAGATQGQNGSFKWLGFPRPDDLGVVYLENLKGGVYLEDDDEIGLFTDEFERLSAVALTARRSVSLMRELARERYE
jgi:Domain of unknown function (DUF5753)